MQMKKYSISTLFILLFLISCTTAKKETVDIYASYPLKFSKVLQAHGGLEKWNSFNTMEFDLLNPEDSSQEHHIIDLKLRKVLVEGDSFKIGFDGKNVWVAPDKKSFPGKSARFYHNLFFYFFSIPYVLADPGVNYQDDTVSLSGENFSCIKATFNAGVGDADKDFYKMIIDPQTAKLTSLLYTVTYYTGEAHEKYNLLKYLEWQQIEGLQFPGRLAGYKYADGIVGEKRYEYFFKNIILKKGATPETLFAMPTEAEIDSLVKH
jgi:hypothetical protein